MVSKANQQPNWNSLTPDQKLDKRMSAWLSAEGVKFASPEAESAYKERIGNIADALLLKRRPRRVPVVAGLGSFAEEYCGYSHKDTMYDVNKAIDVMNRCTLDFQTDVVSAGNSYPGESGKRSTSNCTFGPATGWRTTPTASNTSKTSTCPSKTTMLSSTTPLRTGITFIYLVFWVPSSPSRDSAILWLARGRPPQYRAA